MSYIDVSKLNTGEYADRTLATIKINGVEFKSIGHGMLETANVVTFRETPGRTRNFDMPDLPLQDKRVVPHIKIGFKWIDATEFVQLRQILVKHTEMVVEYYDNDFGKYMTHKMYAQPDDLKAFESLGQKVRGVTNFAVELIGTLNGEPTFTVTKMIDTNVNNSLIPIFAPGKSYKMDDVVKAADTEYSPYYVCLLDNYGLPLSNTSVWEELALTPIGDTVSVSWGSSVMLDVKQGENYPSVDGKMFANMYVDQNGEVYYVGESICVFENLVLRAVYK